MVDEEDTFDVMLGSVGDSAFNTLVLSGVDVVVPLELDADEDPLQDDEVLLRSVDGYYEQVLTWNDPDVARDEAHRLLHYRFRLVPPGVYNVLVRVAGESTEVLNGLIVRRDGVYIGGKRLATERSGPALAPPPPPAEPEVDPFEELFEFAPNDRPYMDQEQD